MQSQSTKLFSETNSRRNGRNGAVDHTAGAPAKSSADAKIEAKPPNDKATADRGARFAQTFAQAVGVLMRAPGYRQLPVANIEPMLLPPLLLGNCRIGYGKPDNGGATTAMTLVLWARVSPAVDQRLSSNLDRPITLQPAEWSSGDIVWLTTLAGDPRALPEFLKQLQEKDFKGQEVKLHTRGADGKVAVKILNQQQA